MIRLTAATVAVVVGILWIVFLRPTFLGGSTSYVMVSGTSMQPTYFTGDLVLTRKQSGYAKGDIVAYHVPQGQPGAGNVVIHRVVGGNATDGYEMRGDNRNADDSWHPKPADAVGRAWLHIPQAGKWLAYFQRPLPFGLLIGFIGAGGFIGKSKVRRRRRNGRLKDMGKQNGTGGGLPAPAWLIGIFAALCLIVVGSAFVGARAFRTDTHKTQTVERLSYDETAAYDYTAHVTPSSLYPTGVIGPVTADGAATIFSPETPTLDLGVKYALKPTNSPPALDFKGEISAVAKISSGESGWSKTINVLPATPFSGMSTEVQLPIDLPQIQALIKTIETETDFAASSYSVVVTPKVHIAGRLGSNAVDETFAPPFTITLSKSEVTLDPSLSRSEPKKQEDKISASQKLSIVGIESSVTQARWLSAVLGIVALSGALAIAAMMWLGIGRGEAIRIRARYGSMVVSVVDATLPADDSQRIRLASIHDLIRLANRDSRMVLHRAQDDGSNVYFIQDGSLTYLYLSPGGATKAHSAPQEA